MAYKIHFGEQGTEEWFWLRRGKITGSKVSDMITPTKLELSKSKEAKFVEWCILHEQRKDISLDKIFDERLETFEMRMGKEQEPEAKKWWKATEDRWEDWKNISFVTHDSGLVGISPDWAAISRAGKIIEGLEVKCPQSKKGYSELVDCRCGEDLRVAKFDYWAQTQLCMWVAELDSWTFLSYVNAAKRENGAICNYFEVEKEPKMFDCFDLILHNLQQQLCK